MALMTEWFKILRKSKRLLHGIICDMYHVWPWMALDLIDRKRAKPSYFAWCSGILHDAMVHWKLLEKISSTSPKVLTNSPLILKLNNSSSDNQPKICDSSHRFRWFWRFFKTLWRPFERLWLIAGLSGSLQRFSGVSQSRFEMFLLCTKYFLK